MLSRLYLKDFAVVSQAEVAFGPGLTVVSGETGAGKSLMVDALLLLTGARADAGMVRHGAERAELSAEFDLSAVPAASHWLAEAELDDNGGCQLRRVIRADGGSRAWINGRPATLAQLGELGERLVEIHGQHEHQALLSRPHQLALLDAFGGHQSTADEVRRLAADWAGLRRRLDQLSRSGEVAERIEQLERHLAELAREELAPEAIETLLSAHKRQANAATLIEGCGRALGLMAGDEGWSIHQALRQVRAEITRLQAHEPRLAEVDTLLDGAAIQVDEAAATLERLRDDLDLDPDRLQAMESRLSRLHDLARRHRVPMDGLQARHDELVAELEQLRGAGEEAERLKRSLADADLAWRAAAARLRQARQQAAERLGREVSALMDELGMAGGRLQAELEDLPPEHPDPQGSERVELLVSANPGQPPRALRKVASGGELSRISLAIEVAALGLDSVPTMVFDEVDTGIGGAVAEVVGQKLRALGRGCQVLCVTHLPQVAALGHQHYRVSKDSDGEATYSAVEVLDDKARTEELARMLGGLEITRETRAHARQMLARGQAD